MRSSRALIALALALALSTCRDGTGPRIRYARVAVAPILPSDASVASFGLVIDHVRLIVVRPASDTLADTTVVLPPDSAALDLNLRVPLISAAETLQVSIVALAGTMALFQGTAPVEVRSGGAPATPTDIPVLTYVGPGAGVDSLVVSPGTPFIYLNDSLRFQVQAFQGGVPVSQFYIAWTTSDTSVARIRGDGTLRAPNTRTSVRVIARTPGAATSVADSTIVTFVPVPTQLAVIAGGGQTGPAGQPLATQLEVEVRASDNLPVPFLAVRFRSLSGGSPADTTVTSDALGRAAVTWTLGPVPGPQTFLATIPAFPAVTAASFSATATGIVISPTTSIITVASGSVISGNTVKLRLQGKDAGGADMTTGGATVTFTRNGGVSTGTISATADSGNGVYTAVFTGVLAGSATTIGATINGAPVTTTLPTIAVAPGAISTAASVITVSNDTVASGASLTLRLQARDAAGNNLATGGAAVAFGFSGGTSTGAVGATADSGSGVYTASFDGVIAGTATVVTATINGSAVTTPKPSVIVIPGAPAQLAFGPAPSLVLTGVVFSTPVQVSAHDLAGNATPAFVGNVTITIGTNPGSGTLTGTLTQTATAGIATFADLAIDLPGIGYALSASSSGLASDTTTSFDVVAPSGTVLWANSAGGNWSNPANWSGGAVPGDSEIAAITLPGTYTVTLDVGDTVAGLQLGASSGTQTLSMTSKALHVSGTTQVNATGVVDFRASVLQGGTLSNSGTVLATGSSTISTAIVTTSTSLIRVQGNSSYGQAFLTVSNGFVNNGTIRLTDTASSFGATMTLPAGQTLTNSSGATIEAAVGAAGGRTLTAALDNQGTLTLSRPLTINRAGAVHTNTGTINVSGGDLTLTQSGAGANFFTAGDITIAAGRSLLVSGGSFAYTGGTVVGAGTLSLTSTTATLTPTLTAGPVGMVITSSTVGGSGTLAVASGASLDIKASTINAAFDNQGVVTFTGSSALNGNVTNAVGGVLRAQGNSTYGQAFLTVANSFTNAGTIILTDTASSFGATLTLPAGATLTNAAGATFQAAAGAAGGRTLTAAIDNQGLVTLNRPLTINRAGAAHTNSGTIDVTGGDLTLTQSGATASFTMAGAGSVTIAPSRTFAVSGGALNYNSGSISGGTLTVTSSTVTSTQPFNTATSALILTSTTWGGGGTITVSAATLLDVRASTINAPLVNQSSIKATGSSAFNGGVSNSAGATITVMGNSTYGQAFLTVGTSFTNGGAIVLTDTSSSFGATLTMPTGATLTNAAGATFESAVGAGGPRTLTAAIDNQGLVTLNRPLTINRASAAHTNSGTIDVSGGDLTLTQSGASASFTISGTGSVTIAPARTFAVSGGALNYTSGSISGGTLTVTSTTVTSTQPFSTQTSALILTSSTWGGSGTITVSPATLLDVRASTINAPLANQSSIKATGSSAFNGGLTNPPGATIKVQGNSTYGQAFLTVGTDFTNGGAIVLTDTGSSFGATLTMPTGTTLTNAPAATIDAAAGFAGPRTLTAALDNQGTLTLNRPLTLNRASAVHANSGTIDVVGAGADLTITQSGTSPRFTNTGAINIAAGDSVKISGGAFDYTGGSISGAGTLALTSVNVTAAQAFNTATAALSLTSSTWGGAGTLTVATGTQLSLKASSINAPFVNQGLLVSSGTSTVGGALTNASGATLRVQGNSTYGLGTLTIASGFTNDGAIELTDTSSSYGATLAVTSGPVINGASGSISALQGFNGARNLNAAFDNRGTISVASAPNQGMTISRAGAQHQNHGTITVSSGDLVVTQTGTTPSFRNAGTISVAAGDTLKITGGSFVHDSGTIGGAGALSLTSLTGTGAFNIPHSIASMIITSSTVSFATAQSTGATGFIFASAVVNGPGQLTNDTGQFLNVRASTINADLFNQGTLLVNGNSNFTGALTTSGTSLIRVQGNGTYGLGTMTIGNGFTNNGTIELTDIGSSYGATLNNSGGTLTNAPGATIAAVIGSGGARTLNAQLDNQGALSVTLASNGALALSRSGATQLNSGTIAVSGGDLNVTQTVGGTFTNTGSISLAGGDTLRITGGAFTHNSGSLGGAGALLLTNVPNATFAAPQTLAQMIVNGSTVAFATPQTTGATGFSFASSTINGPGSLTNDAGRSLSLRSTAVNTALSNLGTLIAHGGTSVTDTLTTATGSLIRVQGDGISGLSTLTVPKGFENAGTIELTDVGSSYGATVAVTNGRLVNLPGAFIDALQGTNGARTITAALDNQGSLRVLLPAGRELTVNRAASVHTNTGTIDISGGNLAITGNTSFQNLGAITLGATDTLSINGGAFSFDGGSLGAGTMVLTSVNPASFNKPHTLAAMALNSSNAVFADSQTTDATSFTLTSSSIGGTGTLTNAALRTISMRSSGISAPFLNQGTVIAHGNSSLDAVTTVAGSTLRVEGDGTSGLGTLTVTGGLVNAGTIELTDVGSSYGATLVVKTLPLVNAGTIDIQPGANGARTIDATIDNQGAFVANRPVTINHADAVHTNRGLYKVRSGSVTFAQSGTNESFTNQSGGSIDIDSSTAFRVTAGPVSNLLGGKISGFGTLDVRTAVFSNDGELIPGASPGTLTIDGNMQIPTTGIITIELGGPTVDKDYDQLVVTGTAIFAEGTLNVSTIGAFDPKGQTFDVFRFGAGSGSFRNFTVPSGCNQPSLAPDGKGIQVICP